MRKIILWFLLLTISVLSAYCMTTQQIIDQVRLLEKDNNSANYRYTDQNLIDRINIIQDEIAIKTMCIQSREYIDTIDGTQEYRLPENCLNIIRVGYMVLNSTDAYKRIPWTTIAGQDIANAYWQNLANGNPTEYYRRTDYIGLKPAPSSTYAGTDYIQIDYNIRPTMLTLVTEIPLDGIYNLTGFHQAIIYGVAALCEYDKGNTNGYTLMQTIYVDWLAKIKDIYYTEPDKNTNFVR